MYVLIDGYPNMNLRQRGSKTDLKAVDIPSDFDDADIDDVDDYESRSARYKQPLSKGESNKKQKWNIHQFKTSDEL